MPSVADEVLALLRINTAESLKRACELMGRPIVQCPPAVPPWPPKPAKTQPKPQRVARINPSPAVKIKNVKVGWTAEQVMQRSGATRRDFKHWVAKGYLEMRT